LWNFGIKGLEKLNTTANPELFNPWEAVSKRGSSVKIKAGDHFNRRHTWSMSRIEM
jgi:hypothetical protein